MSSTSWSLSFSNYFRFETVYSFTGPVSNGSRLVASMIILMPGSYEIGSHTGSYQWISKTMCEEIPGEGLPKQTGLSQGIRGTASTAVQSDRGTWQGIKVRPPVWPDHSPQIDTGASSEPQPWDTLPAILCLQVCFPSPDCFVDICRAKANILTELGVRTHSRHEFNNNP
jgi:hypothetical protein